MVPFWAAFITWSQLGTKTILFTFTSGFRQTSYYLSETQGRGVYILKDGGCGEFICSGLSVVCPSMLDQHRWLGVSICIPNRAYASSSFLVAAGFWGRAVRSNAAWLTLAAFVKALTFAAAVQVTSEGWALLDLDWGVLNHSQLLWCKRRGERKMRGAKNDFKGREKEMDDGKE